MIRWMNDKEIDRQTKIDSRVMVTLWNGVQVTQCPKEQLLQRMNKSIMEKDRWIKETTGYGEL